jgi:hypothetical protein
MTFRSPDLGGPRYTHLFACISEEDDGYVVQLRLYNKVKPAHEVRGFNFNRMVVEFTMLNRDKVVQCAISAAAMDGCEATSACGSAYAAARSN